MTAPLTTADRGLAGSDLAGPVDGPAPVVELRGDARQRLVSPGEPCSSTSRWVDELLPSGAYVLKIRRSTTRIRSSRPTTSSARSPRCGSWPPHTEAPVPSGAWWSPDPGPLGASVRGDGAHRRRGRRPTCRRTPSADGSRTSVSDRQRQVERSFSRALAALHVVAPDADLSPLELDDRGDTPLQRHVSHQRVVLRLDPRRGGGSHWSSEPSVARRPLADASRVRAGSCGVTPGWRTPCSVTARSLPSSTGRAGAVGPARDRPGLGAVLRRLLPAVAERHGSHGSPRLHASGSGRRDLRPPHRPGATGPPLALRVRHVATGPHRDPGLGASGAPGPAAHPSDPQDLIADRALPRGPAHR